MTVTERPTRTATFLEWVDRWVDELPELRWEEDLVRPAGGARNVGLIVVDLQVGFCTEGRLASPRVARLASPIAALCRRAYERGVRDILLTQDWHPEDSPEFAAFGPHCIAGTREAEMVPELAALPFVGELSRLRKGSLSAGIAAEFDPWLEGRPHVREWVLVGDCTDLCVYHEAMYLKLRANEEKLPFQVTVLASLVDTYDVPVETAARVGIMPHDGELMHRLFLYHMALNGIRVARDLQW
jgi:nicotinamidase-related amidase